MLILYDLVIRLNVLVVEALKIEIIFDHMYVREGIKGKTEIYFCFISCFGDVCKSH